MTTLQEEIAQYAQKAPWDTMRGYVLISKPKHAQLPDYSYGYTVRAFRANKTTFEYAQIMWDFDPIKKTLFGVKEKDYPWEDEDLTWVQGSEILSFSDPTEFNRIEDIVRAL